MNDRSTSAWLLVTILSLGAAARADVVAIGPFPRSPFLNHHPPR
jgi:hypothetical protein